MRSGSPVIQPLSDANVLEAPSEISFDRDILGELATSSRREWLVTNGIGGFASGTVSGLQTRRYHALLVAALRPPVGRTVLVASIDETIEYDRSTYALATARWHDGTLGPQGFRHLERFRLDGTIPIWTYACADALIEKRIWMEQGENATYVRYTVLRASRLLELHAHAMVNYRDFHSSTHAGDWMMSVEPLENGVNVVAFDGAVPFDIRSDRAQCEPAHIWYRNYDLEQERARGLDDSEDRLHAATFNIILQQEESVTFIASVREGASVDGIAALERQHAHEDRVLSVCGPAPSWIARLALAADQFIVRRPIDTDPDALSIIAGYHWFGDWGRDTMIALPGLCLATGRPSIAAKILETFARYVNDGILPNFFPDAGEVPQYNTVDASLWFIEAVRQYVAFTGDVALVQRVYPALIQIVRRYHDGTRYNIHCDAEDGLIWAGETGVQLTWMDAKVDDWVVTPRIGKPIEVNALWYNALHTVGELGRMIGSPDAECDLWKAKALAGFARFWNSRRAYCYDVIDGPDGADASLRPNQLFAVSLAQSPLSSLQQRSVVDACTRALLTTYGLRSLAPNEPQFRPFYGGTPFDRDGAYHQGTVWTWLIGPYVLAHLRVYGDRVAARRVVETAGRQVAGFGLGTLAEIADATPPFTPNGCIAQAWSVAEILRVWRALEALSEGLAP
jgi:predicted glycogen debranching enzyme